MTSRGAGTAFSRKNYRLSTEPEKSKVTGIVNSRLLNDYLHRVFTSADGNQPAAAYRKHLTFQNLQEHLERLLAEENGSEESRDQVAEGRLGPSTVVLDHTSGFEGLLLVDDDLLGVIGHSNFGSIRATTCVYKGKWIYEVLISSQGLMQIGWCTLNCRFNQEEGVGDTPDSYAYDGNRVRKWNVTTTNYGKSWAAGDIVSCLIDLDEGTIAFCLNGISLGTAFDNITRGAGMAYFPAISLSFKESVAFNFGSRPLRYPVEGYRPLQDPPVADLVKARKLLGYLKNVIHIGIDVTEGKLVEKDTSMWQLQGEPTVLITLAHIFNYFSPLMCKVYLVEDVLMTFLLSILERGGAVEAHPLIQQLLDLMWLLMEEYEVHECLKQLLMSLLRAYRFSPIIPDLGLQIHYLRLTIAVLKHEKSRKYLLSNVLFDVLRSVVFFYIKSPLRVEEAGLQELIPTTWWPNRFTKEGKESKEVKEESAEERLRRRAYERGCQRLKKRIEVVEGLQVQILKLLLNNKDRGGGEASRYIFLNKFRKFLQENASNRGNLAVLCPPEYMVCFLHRLIAALRYFWDGHKAKTPASLSSEEAYVPPQLFYNGKVDYFDLQRLGGLLSHLKKTLKDDLAAKANILIDPAELQAVTMDDLDEDEESATSAAQSQRPSAALAIGGALARPAWLSSPTLGRANRFLSTAAVSLMNPRRPLGALEKIKVLTLRAEQRTREDIEGTHGNDGLLLGRPPEEPDQPITENSLLEVLDGIVMMYNLSVHQQLGKMVGVSDDVNEYAMALKDTEEKISRCPKRRRDIHEELLKSQKVFSEKLNHLSRRLAWINVTIYSKEKMQDIYWLLRVCIRTIEHGDRTGSLFAFMPEFYLSVAMNSYSALKNYFSPVNSMEELPGYEETLMRLAAILAKHFADSRIVGTDIRDSLMQALASYVCYPHSLRAVERIPEEQRISMMKNLLAPYEQRPWAQTNWILVRLWRGCGFGYRYTRLPHLLKTKPEDASLPSLQRDLSVASFQKPCPSTLLQRHMADLLRSDRDLAPSFLNSVLNQLNWAFSEFIGMIQEIQQAAERLERNFVDSRQLKVCATCFDLSVSLLRVLEMTVTLAPEIFLDWNRPSSELLLRRLAQLLNQVLNRVTAERNLFDRVVNLRLPGLESVDHYPILVAVTGILVRLLVDTDVQGTERATAVLLADPCFQLRSIQYLLGHAEPSALAAAAPATDKRHFSLHTYTEYISTEELAKVEKMLNHLSEESKQAAATTLPTSEEDLCPICYAHPISAIFRPCSHKSCKACINQHLMNNKDCFFCKATITGVDDFTKPASS
ncbi:E3 ubiquitin-protein ligase RNF123 isoform X1 [Pyrgilauda ruficollis]|uniref:E3 ubiquitin-protein ligase RNF123 isoform X1 n=1 Tax=Onychostruthus taczanowskii TaxID=356909 RepID=UPI001B8063B2|nr:E3 ubiquitin-protein ligase RNF123 isoform X1 [Onychostruthus taczanowskii]XP_041281583.1 E3 ubiquitin-protein ligase RNF123 isoform X1 [Onychostruthus taczanowskii]XP_041317554.1 E3 ubiquitin-protein ligase RNF123 isoform X1 [Pyrgilauda ruficollis]XP_041317561.1 E3 ubiquitin-protein ligase RNF123 isoform X1 [Pyrgilauda ruficollis]XP_041317568.1 E3 ubiquitin-protein ligase RNF123 isoform X1 [Pyrgilauda ruficollis]XP_041317577.1 E3 ubiquitin-protein ligase RNF123 isoform X1 [Pyrgilauda rufic